MYCSKYMSPRSLGRLSVEVKLIAAVIEIL